MMFLGQKETRLSVKSERRHKRLSRNLALVPMCLFLANCGETIEPVQIEELALEVNRPVKPRRLKAPCVRSPQEESSLSASYAILELDWDRCAGKHSDNLKFDDDFWTEIEAAREASKTLEEGL